MSTNREWCSQEARSSETFAKVALLRNSLFTRFEAVVLRSPAAVAWLTAGGRSHMALTPEVGVAAIIVRPDKIEIVTSANEMPRLEEEEIGILDAVWTVLPWQKSLLGALPNGPRIAADVPYADAANMGGTIARMRATLTNREVAAYRALGRDVAESFTVIAPGLQPNLTEYEVAGLLAAQFNARGIDATLLLVAGGERLPVHRHPLPTKAPIGSLVMIVACGRRDGLIACATRFVAPRPIAPHLKDSYRRLLDVEAAYLDATQVGNEIGAVWRAGTAAYRAHGFDAEEWTRHHQGGPSGYVPREFLADGSERECVLTSQAFGWNPSCASLKTEDIVVTTDEGLEIMTSDPAWPSVTVSGRARPTLLEL